MAQIFNMPQLGSTMEEGTILKWHKQEGETVKSGDILLEIETDKATMEVEATSDGVVRKILVPADKTVAIREPIALIAGADEPIDALLAQLGLDTEGVQVSRYSGIQDKATTPIPEHLNTRIPEHPTPNTQLPTPTPVFLSPRARRIADEKGVAVAALAGRGTGPEGRIVERDVLAYLNAQPVLASVAAIAEVGKAVPRVTPLAARMADDLGVDLGDLATGLPGSRVRREDVLRHAETRTTEGEKGKAQLPNYPTTQHPTPNTLYTVVPLIGMRKRIADNVAKSAFTAPHVTLTLEVDMTEAVTFRARLIPDIEKAYGVKLTYNDILVKAIARALGEHPMANAALIGDEIRVYSPKNIGVAVALDNGLITPVVKDADKKSLGAVAAELKQLVERARTGKFTPDDLSGGTFTITNLGAFGIDVFDPVINPPQAAILGVCRIAEKPVVLNKEVVIRSMMNLCLSFDHRVLDGAPAARFLARLKELLETPLLILV